MKQKKNYKRKFAGQRNFSFKYLQKKEKLFFKGLQIETTGDGLHIIREVKFQTPADLCRKIESGDEILDVNGQLVVRTFTSGYCSCKCLLINF